MIVRERSLFDQLQIAVSNVIAHLRQKGLIALAGQYQIELGSINNGVSLVDQQCALGGLFQLIDRIRQTLQNQKHPDHDQMKNLTLLLVLSKDGQQDIVQ